MSELNPIDELYREVVLDHYRKPRNRAALAHPDGQALVHNPLCGDQVQVEVKLADGRIHEVSARTRGCSIAVAAGSVMTELILGLEPAGTRELADNARALVGGQVPPELDRRLQAFERVRQLPSRQRCALLPWEALEQALEQAAATG